MGAGYGERVQGLIWRGGMQLTSQSSQFGGISGLGFVDAEGRLAAVSDKGQFISGQLIYDDMGRPFGLVGVEITAIQNSRGADLPRASGPEEPLCLPQVLDERFERRLALLGISAEQRGRM